MGIPKDSSYETGAVINNVWHSETHIVKYNDREELLPWIALCATLSLWDLISKSKEEKIYQSYLRDKEAVKGAHLSLHSREIGYLGLKVSLSI